MNDLLYIIGSALTGGGLSWIFTLRWTRASAKADAMKSVQDVYQELINDLRTDRDSLRDTIKALNERISDLEGQTANNTRLIKSMQPMICSNLECKNRCTAKNLS